MIKDYFAVKWLQCFFSNEKFRGNHLWGKDLRFAWQVRSATVASDVIREMPGTCSYKADCWALKYWIHQILKVSTCIYHLLVDNLQQMMTTYLKASQPLLIILAKYPIWLILGQLCSLTLRARGPILAVRIWRLILILALKELTIYDGRKPITYNYIQTKLRKIGHLW